MEQHIQQGDIVILDVVKEEVLKGDDSLQQWMKSLEIKYFVDHRQNSIIQKYGEILQYIQQSSSYKESALKEWSKESAADPWLIATAALHGYTIITFEKENKGINSRNASAKAKIPNVAKEFGVQVEDLFYMMRKLNFKL